MKRYAKKVAEGDIRAPLSVKQNAEKYWEKFFAKRIVLDGDVKLGVRKVKAQIVIWAEGDSQKRIYNPMLVERLQQGSEEIEYKVADRYGLWACKNFIPIQRIDHWLEGKGSYTKLHGFVNYDGFTLTANRSSIENTPTERLKALKKEVAKLYRSIENGEGDNQDYVKWLEIETEAQNERKADEEKAELSKRIKKAKRNPKMLKIGQNRFLVPSSESEVALLLAAVLQEFQEEAVLPYEIVDYNSSKGVDFLVRDLTYKPKPLSGTPETAFGYVELKKNLTNKKFNHAFKNIKMIVCYDIGQLKEGEVMEDLEGEQMKLKRVSTRRADLAIRYSLVGDGNNKHEISIFLLESFLKSKKISATE